ncbi:MAG: carboxypeptidase-like regulatory domain-containing protein, partial [Niabella sp.]|nr:carboxypeptidase-like regulatory domain-containing protein [Niabella sp.]
MNAQNEIRVSGTVTDTAHQPIANASIKAGRFGTITNEQGHFSVLVKDLSQSIEVSSIGFESQKVRAINEEMTVMLNPSRKTSMDEVIVVGVQSQTKRNTLAAVSGITAKDIENRPVASVDALLQGRIAGLNVQITSGEPGVAPTLIVRGNSNVSKDIGDVGVAQSAAVSGPLYVIDGIPMNPADMA